MSPGDELRPDAAAMLAMAGPDMTIEVERAEAAVVRDGHGVTLSREALEALGTEITLWVASRMLRAIDRGAPPQRVTVRVVVKLDGELAQ